MRLIDADALKQQFEIWDEDDEVAVWSIMNEINSSPTIELARKKGRWILKKELVPLPWDSDPLDWNNYDEKTHSEWKEYYHCSNCDWKSGEFKGGNFCRNCGADMRGEGEE